jgi:hypothetical protein
MCGDRNTIRHFNGISWVQLGSEYNPQCEQIWYRNKIKKNTAISVGRIVENDKAIISLFKRG